VTVQNHTRLLGPMASGLTPFSGTSLVLPRVLEGKMFTNYSHGPEHHEWGLNTMSGARTPTYAIRTPMGRSKPPRVPSRPLHKGPMLPRLSSGPSTRMGPSLQASMCPWSPLSARIGVQSRHVARRRVVEAFG
jgi:hypothetical protein